MAYIYQIINDINGKSYIGKTEFSIEKRFKEHCNDAFKKNNEKRPLYAAMRKYGIKHFHIFLIEETNDPQEREIYWIEKKHTFKQGYNATLGGDGKKYIDYDLVITNYQELKSQKKVAEKMGINIDSVAKILKQNNEYIYSSKEVNKNTRGKIVKMYDKKTNNFLQCFASIGDAAHYLIENNLTNCKFSTIHSHISEVCRGKRKSAAGYKWKFN